MIRSRLKNLLDQCFQQGVEQKLWSDAAAGLYNLESPRHEGQGDFATNFAMIVAGKERRKPREVAEQLTKLLQRDTVLLDKVEIAGPGFVNLFLNPTVWSSVLAPIAAQGEQFGLCDLGKKRKVMVEFVSANPTGPLTVGHGRNAVLGDAVAHLLTAAGYDVTREYYFNDAGRQMRVLAASLKARYLEKLGLPNEFPEDGYQGDYMYDIAQGMIDEAGDGFKDADMDVFRMRAQDAIFVDIDATLKRIGICFDSYYNERDLYEKGLIEDVVAELRAKDLVYEQDDATWFKTTAFGQPQDRDPVALSRGAPQHHPLLRPQRSDETPAAPNRGDGRRGGTADPDRAARRRGLRSGPGGGDPAAAAALQRRLPHRARQVRLGPQRRPPLPPPQMGRHRRRQLRPVHPGMGSPAAHPLL